MVAVFAELLGVAAPVELAGFPLPAAGNGARQDAFVLGLAWSASPPIGAAVPPAPQA